MIETKKILKALKMDSCLHTQNACTVWVSAKNKASFGNRVINYGRKKLLKNAVPVIDFLQKMCFIFVIK